MLQPGEYDDFILVPLKITMGLVSEYIYVKGNPANMGKYILLRIWQSNFCRQTVGITNDYVMYLDHRDKGIGDKNLNELIMDINSVN